MRFFRKIEGERLYLSPFDAADAASCAKWAEWMNEKAVADYYGGFNNVVSLSSAKKTLEELKGYRFDIVLNEGDLLIGHVSLHDVNQLNRNAFIGIFVGGGEHRNRGYGAEAMRLALGFGFKTLNLNVIALSVFADNAAAIACYEKVGFRHAGRLREWVYKDGEYVDRIFMDMLSREFGSCRARQP